MLKDSCSQREQGLDNFLNEVRQLKDRMERVIPSYLASLERISQLPEELEHRWWSSRVDALLQKVKSDYQNYQSQAQKVDILSKFTTLGIDIALKAGGMQPVAPPPSPRIGISISPSGKIEPALLDDQYKPPNVILITFEEFEAVTHRLKVELLKGTIVPTSEEEIPGLIRDLALKKKD
jgi:hypothetical protein